MVTHTRTPRAGGAREGGGGRRDGGRRFSGRQERSDMDKRMLDLRRTARVVAGGRRFSFRAVVIVGNRNGRVGVGVGKAPDVAGAIEKGAHQARKNVMNVPLTKTRSIPHEVSGKYGAAYVILKPAREGHGLVAGGPVRVVADLVGIRNLTAKIRGRTSNKLNNARAVIEAFKSFRQPSSVKKSEVVEQTFELKAEKSAE